MPRMRNSVRLLHTSDVHLGTDLLRYNETTHQPDCLCPLDMISDLVVEHVIDVVVIAGDLFDHGRVSDELVTSTFQRLAKLPCDVVLLPGNHDVYDTTSALYRRHRPAIDAAKVKFFDEPAGKFFDVASDALRIWARAMEEHSPEFRPLDGSPSHPEDRWFVVAGHGHFAPDGTETHRSSRIDVGDIDATGADYVALGHWHVTTDLGQRGTVVPAWYPGTPAFGHGAGNMLIVSFTPGEAVQVRPVDVLENAVRCSVRTSADRETL